MEGINTPFVIDEHTAIVMTDPQNDFLSENGLGWGAFGENIQKNGTVENLRRIFEVAAAKGMLVFISPHYYYKHDHQWLFEGPMEKLMHDTGMFERRGQLTVRVPTGWNSTNPISTGARISSSRHPTNCTGRKTMT